MLKQLRARIAELRKDEERGIEYRNDRDYRVVGRPLVGDGSTTDETFDRLTYWGTFGFFSLGDLSSQVPIEAFFVGRQWVLFKRDKFTATEV